MQSKRITQCDLIAVEGLECSAWIGCNPEERLRRQPISLSFQLECDVRDACRSDNLADTVNYDALSRILKSVIEESSFALLERLAEECAQRSLGYSPRVQAVTIRLEKPQAIPGARTAVVQIHREREGGREA